MPPAILTARSLRIDTAMALCLADALLECEGNIDPEIIGRNILAWAERFDAFNKNVTRPDVKNLR
ncbi:hydrolase [Salmonella enterica subsp. enterica]|uniref:Hydrolase n=1 Tax=Salmonella enterica I TaxID=59201 RepID=A0A447U069_SALET|nr:hydrolase [Salmonella enterica subsp. enterica]